MKINLNYKTTKQPIILSWSRNYGTTMGLWCKKGKEWLNQLGLKIVETTGDVKSKYFLMQSKT